MKLRRSLCSPVCGGACGGVGWCWLLVWVLSVSWFLDLGMGWWCGALVFWCGRLVLVVGVGSKYFLDSCVVGVGCWCGLLAWDCEVPAWESLSMWSKEVVSVEVVGVNVSVGWWCGVLAWGFEVKALRSSSMWCSTINQCSFLQEVDPRK